MWDVFISYSTKDKNLAFEILKKIEENEIDAWIAPRNVRPMFSYPKEIVYGIENSEILLLIFSSNSSGTDNVLNELEIAHRKRKKILNFKIDETEVEGDHLYYLARPQAIDAAHMEKDKAIELLVRSIKDVLAELEEENKEPEIEGLHSQGMVNESEIVKTPQGREMVIVKSGSFQMGNTRNDSEGFEREKPIHDVELTYEYCIGKNPVTFEEYDEFCEATGREAPHDEDWGRGKRPVINVTWKDAIEYCNWLSRREGLSYAYDPEDTLLDGNGKITTDIMQVNGYRLPTEAEWEYAARGGHKHVKLYKYAGSNRMDEVGWYWKNSGDERLEGTDSDWDWDAIIANNNRTQEVGQKKANELGLHDMSGNVWEWCHDWYGEYTSDPQVNPIGPNKGTYRVERGGSWYINSCGTRIAIRFMLTPIYCYNNLGFRLARTIS